MKKIGFKISILAWLLFVVMAFQGEAVYATESNGDFNIFAETLQGYSGTDSDIEIPAGIKIISDYCFENNNTVRKITVPEGVEVIGKSAFSGCENLEEVVLPNSLKEIGEYAFNGCTKLTKVTMPNTLTSAGYGIFLRCSALQSIVWPACAEIPSSAFAECTSLTSVTIPEGVTKIGDHAFQRSGITTMVLPQSLTTIGERCFEESAITSINIPSKVTEIPEYTFHVCKNLQSISIQGALQTIGAWSFFECSALTAFPTVDSLTTIRDHAFGHSGVKEMTIPNLQVLENEAFGTSSLEKITIGGPITTIPEHCFQASKNLTTVVLSDNIKRIEYAAFNVCENLTNINMPVSLEYVGSSVFTGCKIPEFKFYDAVTTLEDWSLSGCKGLKKVILPGNVPNLSINFMDRHKNTIVEAPEGSNTYNLLKNAGYKVVALGSASTNGGGTSNGGGSTNGGGSSNGGNTSNKEEIPSNSETLSLEETLIKDTVEKIEAAKDGDKIVVQVDSLDQKVLEILKGKDIELTLELGTYSWVINGKTLTNDAYSKIDMKVTLDSNAIDASVVEALAKDTPTKQLSLAHNGEFGFSAQLFINLGSEYAGQFGRLYYYNSEGKLEFQSVSEIAEDGTIGLVFTHASDYVIVITEEAEESTDVETEMTESEESLVPEETEQLDNQDANKGGSGNGFLIAFLVILVIAGAAGGGYWYWKNKVKND